MDDFHRMPECFCFGCGEPLNTVGSLSGKHKDRPREGDATVCFDCGHIMVFKADGTLRELTDAEIVEVAGDKELLAVQALRAASLLMLKVKGSA